MKIKAVKDIESIGSIYALTIKRLQAAISQALLSSDWQAAKLLQTAMSILKQGQREVIEVVKRNGLTQYQEQREAKFEELRTAGFDFNEVGKVLNVTDVAAVLNAEDRVRRFFAQIAEPTRNLIQSITVRVRQKAAEEGLSSGKAFRALRDEVMGKRPNFTFVDRAGRQWEPEKYLKMVSRTLMDESQREAHEAAYAEAGVDLVKVSTQGTKCPRCYPWEGRVLSLTGATAGFPTVAEARGEGLFHPNCKHRLLAHVA